MRQLLRITVPALLLLANGATDASGQARLESLFPRRAAISGEAATLLRLELPAEILTTCRADLSDLRIVDADGREVPFMVVGADTAGHRLRARRTLTPDILEVSRRRTDSQTAPPVWHETYVLSPPPVPSDGESWELVLQIKASSFVRRLSLEAEDRSGVTVELPVADSLFRFTDPPRERTRLSLPDLALHRIEVTLEGEGDGYLEPAFAYESTRDLPASEKATVALDIVATDRRGTITIVDLARPRGLVPDTLVLDTDAVAFRRQVTVVDRGAGARPGPLAEGIVYRLSDELEERRLRLAPAAGESLRLEIDDGDSPPLEGVRVTAELRRPVLLFALSGEAGSPATGELLFGGGRTFFPRYDIAGLLPALPASGEAAELAVVLRDPESLPRARLGALESNPAFDQAPLLAFAMRPGAGVDVARFSHRRRLHAPHSTEGLLRLPLTPADLAVARPDLADLRLVDEAERQRGYLIQARARRPLLDLEPERITSREGVSHLELSLPARPFVLDALEIESPLSFFDRQAELVATLPRSASRGARDMLLWRGRLVRRMGDGEPLLLAFPERRIDDLELRIVDGDDAPLELGAIRARVPLPDLYFAVPAGEYTLLVGDPDAEAPTYEIERVRSLVLSVTSMIAEADELEQSPRFSAAARWRTGSGLERLLVWGSLALAVAVMLALTLRLARGGGANGPTAGD